MKRIPVQSSILEVAKEPSRRMFWTIDGESSVISILSVYGRRQEESYLFDAAASRKI